MDTVSSYIITGLMANFKEIVNLATRKNVPKYLGKTQIIRMIRKFLCSIAAISKVDKVHLSIVTKLLVFHHRSRHLQQFKKI